METAAGDGRKGHMSEHFNGTDGARTKNSKHPRCDYNNVASNVSERGQVSAGAAAGEDGHGATENSAGQIRAEEGGEKPQRAPSAGPQRRRDEGETEDSPPPPNGRAHLMRAVAEGGKGDGDPHPEAHTQGVQRGHGEGPLITPTQDPPRDR